MKKLQLVTTVLVVAGVLFSATLFAGKPVLEHPYVFTLRKGKKEAGSFKKVEKGIVIEPDSRILYRNGKLYGLRNGSVRVDIVPPDLKGTRIPLLVDRKECLCSFKVHIGRLVVELSDRGVRVVMQDENHSAVDAVLADMQVDMVPDGIVRQLAVTIEDRQVMVELDGERMVTCPVATYDFSMIHLGTFGHPFTATDLSVYPVFKPALVYAPEGNALQLAATYHPSHFNHGTGLHNHHFITWRGGRAAAFALIQTELSDSLVHAALVRIGATPGNNLTQDAWEKRRDRSSKEPDRHAEGTALTVSVLYGGKEYPAEAILRDEKNNPYHFRFAGNLALIPEWRSGCVVCLQSCPGSKIANSTYTIRDLENKKVAFEPKSSVPFTEGDPIIVKIALKK